MHKKFYYLHIYDPVIIHAEKRTKPWWYIPDLKMTVHESDLYTDLSTFLLDSLKKLRERRDEVQLAIKQAEGVVCSTPCEGARPTKVPYLWTVKGGSYDK